MITRSVQAIGLGFLLAAVGVWQAQETDSKLVEIEQRSLFSVKEGQNTFVLPPNSARGTVVDISLQVQTGSGGDTPDIEVLLGSPAKTLAQWKGPRLWTEEKWVRDGAAMQVKEYGANKKGSGTTICRIRTGNSSTAGRNKSKWGLSNRSE